MQELTINVITRWDADAARMLYEHFYGALVSYGMRILQDRESAEDVVQDTMAALWERKTVLPNNAALKAYLYNSVRNKCLSLLRRQRIESLDPLAMSKYEEFRVTDDGNEQFFPEGIGGADNRDNRIAAHGERNGAPLLLLFVQLAREHGEIGHPVQDIGHPFPGPAGRNVNADAGMRGLESLFPFHSQGEERKGSGNRHLSGDILNFPLCLCAGAGDGGKEQENSQGKGRF